MAKKAVKKTKKEIKKEQELYMYVFAVILIAISIIAYSRQGVLGIFLSNLANFLFGRYSVIVLVVFVSLSVLILISRKKKFVTKRTIVAIILLLFALFLYSALDSITDEVGLEIVNSYLESTPKYFENTVLIQSYGGLVGALLLSLTTVLVAKTGTYIVIVALVIIASLLLISLDSYKQAFESLKKFFTLPEKLMNAGYEEEYYEDDEYEKYEEIIEEKQSVEQIKYAGALDNDYTIQNENTNKSIFLTLDPEPTVDTVDSESLSIKNEKLSQNNTSIVDSTKTVAASKPTTTSPYKIPSYDILDPIGVRTRNTVNQSAAKDKAKKLLDILRNFGIEATLIGTHIGPSVTKFEIKPESNVKVSKIISIQDNIKMELAARDIRIEAPIPGRNAVGIEIPNVESTPVKMKEIILQIPHDKKNKPLLLALGKDLLGKPVFCQLDKMPHLLIAGATGSGKSVCMNSIITSLLLRTSPDDVKLLLIDPKKVEFTQYANIPHLIGPVISDSNHASNALKVIVQIMEERYEVFSAAQVRNIQVYNEKVKQDPTDALLKPMPYIVVIIDELADLMAVAGKEVELSIQRITQLARAAGIHLIVATQRPSTDVITGIIKANIPSRIAFSVSSGIDSRTILDHVGAERLLGYGDMLYLPIGEPSSIRLQGVYVTDEEVVRIADFCASQRAPMYDDAFIRLEGVDGNEGTAVISANEDPLYQEVKDYVIEVQKASTSLLQRRFGIGYNRAARMIDILENNGIIGPVQGSKPRDVYVKKEEELS
ncbi:MAG: DNA translocase FtsK [Erysipelotrichaceae bacterium]|nr:DNA translocase FtsK [Erysipelotrichaceae bacterium]